MEIINKIFKACVLILQRIAEISGTTYEFVNVIIFCFLIPLAFVILIILYRGARRDSKKYKDLYHKFLSQDMNNFDNR